MTGRISIFTAVSSGLAEQLGVGRSTTYRLALSSGSPEAFESISNEGQMMAYVREHGEITNQQCRKLLGLDADQTYCLIKKLCDKKRLTPQGKGRWRKYILY